MTVRQADICSFRVQKGKLGDYQFNALDYVPPCRGEECQIHENCIYFQGGVNMASCRVEANYLRSVHETWGLLIQKAPDPFLMQWVGTHIIKLYHHLFKMHMEEMALKSLTYTDKGGKKAIEPVIEAQEKVMERIVNHWQKLNLFELAKECGFLTVLTDPANARRVAGGAKPGAGDPGFYSRMKRVNASVDEKE